MACAEIVCHERQNVTLKTVLNMFLWFFKTIKTLCSCFWVLLKATTTATTNATTTGTAAATTATTIGTTAASFVEKTTLTSVN